MSDELKRFLSKPLGKLTEKNELNMHHENGDKTGFWNSSFSRHSR